MVASVVAVSIVAVNYASIDGRIKCLADDSLVFASMGIGIWVTASGAAIPR